MQRTGVDVGMSGGALEIKAHYTLPKPSISSPTSFSSGGWVLTNGSAEARGGAKRDGEREAGSGCM